MRMTMLFGAREPGFEGALPGVGAVPLPGVAAVRFFVRGRAIAAMTTKVVKMFEKMESFKDSQSRCQDFENSRNFKILWS
jgi:hypothetical protein